MIRCILSLNTRKTRNRDHVGRKNLRLRRTRAEIEERGERNVIIAHNRNNLLTLRAACTVMTVCFKCMRRRRENESYDPIKAKCSFPYGT